MHDKHWLYLLKLWWYTKTEHSKSLKMILLTVIISFLEHALLDTYDETNDKYSNLDIGKEIFLIYISERSSRNEALKNEPYINNILITN